MTMSKLIPNSSSSVIGFPFVVKHSALPGESCTCHSTSFAALSQRLQDLWAGDELLKSEDDATHSFIFSYHLPASGVLASANTFVEPTFTVKMTGEMDFRLWSRCATRTYGNPNAELAPLTNILSCHDANRCVHCLHSNPEFNQAYTARNHAEWSPLVSGFLLKEIGAAYAIRHSVVDEVIFIADANEEVEESIVAAEALWLTAVDRARRAWGVSQPLFRYQDTRCNGDKLSASSYEFSTINITTEEDFSYWYCHKRTLRAELVCYENALPGLMDGGTCIYNQSASLDENNSAISSETQQNEELLNPDSNSHVVPTLIARDGLPLVSNPYHWSRIILLANSCKGNEHLASFSVSKINSTKKLMLADFDGSQQDSNTRTDHPADVSEYPQAPASHLAYLNSRLERQKIIAK